ncbi:MAG: hypothetical protein R3C40_06340 [Parvularculaceae bacterium]
MPLRIVFAAAGNDAFDVVIVIVVVEQAVVVIVVVIVEIDVDIAEPFKLVVVVIVVALLVIHRRFAFGCRGALLLVRRFQRNLAARCGLFSGFG